MTPRNIYFADEEEAAPELENRSGGAEPETVERLRLRDVTNDPLREYQQRAGEVRALPDAVAAMILFKKGARCVENHAIEASVDGVERIYSSRDSLVIAEMNGKGVKVHWCANRRKPDVIHLMSANGGYLETLPLKGEVIPFADSEENKRVIADAVSHKRRDARRLAELHAPDMAAAAAREAHNAGELARKVREDERIVAVFDGHGKRQMADGKDFPAPTAGMDRTQADTAEQNIPLARGRGTFLKAERVCQVEAAVEAVRGRRATAAEQAQREVEIGRALRAEAAEEEEEIFVQPQPTEEDIEKW